MQNILNTHEMHSLVATTSNSCLNVSCLLIRVTSSVVVLLAYYIHHDSLKNTPHIMYKINTYFCAHFYEILAVTLTNTSLTYPESRQNRAHQLLDV